MKTVYYSTEDDETSINECKISDYSNRPEYIIDRCAEDYHDNHDGHTSDWPLVFTLHSSAEWSPVGSFIVERDFTLVFSVNKVE